jgi:hypothetical protein
MGWLIDTNIWIAVERGELAAADIYAITRQNPIFISPVNVAEMQFGLDLLKPGATKQRATASLRRLQRKPQLRITIETGTVFGTMAAKLKKSGRAADFRINDLWLAAQAIQRDFSLLTSNSKDFADIPSLKLVSLPLT